MFMSDVVVATALAHILVLRACADMQRAHVFCFWLKAKSARGAVRRTGTSSISRQQRQWRLLLRR